MLRFKLNWDKAIESMVWLADRKPDITFFYISKVLYYADKWHLERYARPITGDIYIAMDNGPVPSRIYDLLKQSYFMPIEALDDLNQAIEINRHSVRAKRRPRDGVLSGSDVRLLGESLDSLIHLGFAELSNLTHLEPAWANAPLNGEMDVESMISSDIEDREALIEEIREKAIYGMP